MRRERRKSTEHGLHLRMHYECERIRSQHTQLGELHQLVARALDRGEVHSARRSFERFEEALRAHLEVEERIYFPALHGLRPSLAEDIARLVREHDAIVALLPGLRGLLRAGEMELSRERLRDLARLISEHEAQEEILIEDSLRSGPNETGEAPRDVSSHPAAAGHAERRARASNAAEGLARRMQSSEDEEDA